MSNAKEKGMCKACLQAELDIEALESELHEAREAARWMYLMAEDHASTVAKSRWPKLFQEDTP